jgi:hypothetical protein
MLPILGQAGGNCYSNKGMLLQHLFNKEKKRLKLQIYIAVADHKINK